MDVRISYALIIFLVLYIVYSNIEKKECMFDGNDDVKTMQFSSNTDQMSWSPMLKMYQYV
jgi:hypothetical protein